MTLVRLGPAGALLTCLNCPHSAGVCQSKEVVW